MAEIKLTKNELRAQQARLQQLLRYLPTLQLKKAMLQTQVNDARLEIVALQEVFAKSMAYVEESAELLTVKTTVDPKSAVKIKEVRKHYENIAGVEVPFFEGVTFEAMTYSLFETPPWIDGVVAGLRKVAEASARVAVAEEKKRALEKELREVSIRVNLFEKVLIPRSLQNIKKIRVFLGDQQLAAVSQAKVAKNKIEERKAAVDREMEMTRA